MEWGRTEHVQLAGHGHDHTGWVKPCCWVSERQWNAWLSWPLGPTAYLFFSSRLSVMINRKKNMVVSFGDGVTFVVVLHQVWKKEPAHHDFLGFYVVDSRGMSAQTHGLLGMKCSSFRLFRPQGGGKKPR